MAQPKVLLYAELLPNIRQISVMVALDQPCYTSTKGLLSADGRHIVLTHGGENYTLNLPEQAIPTAQLQKPVVGSKELSWRLPVAGLSSLSSAEFVQSNDAPWSAKDLGSSSEFSCRKCGAVIVQKDVVKSWRDLPSENWAEMMDFWHCHKPEDKPDVEANGENSHARHNHTSDPNANRAYGANTKFIAQSGIGFVDLTSFLLVDSDCQNLQVKYSFLYIFLSLLEFLRVSRRRPGSAFAAQWFGHRYKYPRLTPSYRTAQAAVFLTIPSSLDYGLPDDWRLRPRPFTPYLPRGAGRSWD